MKFHISGAAGQKNGQSDRERNFDVMRLATKPQRRQEHGKIFSSCLWALVAKLLNEVSYEVPENDQRFSTTDRCQQPSAPTV